MLSTRAVRARARGRRSTPRARERTVLVLAAAGLVAAGGARVHRGARAVRFGATAARHRRRRVRRPRRVRRVREERDVHGRRGRQSTRGPYPSECAVGDQIFYNTAANALADGDGFIEPLWQRDPSRGEAAARRRPPAADGPRAGAGVVAGRATAAGVDRGRRPRRERARAPLHDGAARHRCSSCSSVCSAAAAGGDAVGLVAAGIAAVSPEHLGERRARDVRDDHEPRRRRRAAARRSSRSTDRPSRTAARRSARCAASPRSRGPSCCCSSRCSPFPSCGDARALAGRIVRSRVGRERARRRAVGRVQPRPLRRARRSSRPTTASRSRARTATPSYYGDGDRVCVVDATAGCVDDPPPPGDQSEVAKVYRDRAFDYIARSPGRAPVVALARVGRTWSLYRPARHGRVQPGRGPRAVGDAARPRRVLPDARRRDRGPVVLWRRRQRAALWVLLVPAIVGHDRRARSRTVRRGFVPRPNRRSRCSPRSRSLRWSGWLRSRSERELRGRNRSRCPTRSASRERERGDRVDAERRELHRPEAERHRQDRREHRADDREEPVHGPRPRDVLLGRGRSALPTRARPSGMNMPRQSPSGARTSERDDDPHARGSVDSSASVSGSSPNW